MKNKNKLEKVLSLLTIIVCILLYMFFPTNSIFEEIISFFVFVFILPTLYIKIILKKELQKKETNKNIFFQFLIGLLFGIIFAPIVAYLFSIIPLNTFTYKNSILEFKNNIGLFFVDELSILFFNIIAFITLGYVFTKKILHNQKNNWVIAYIITSLVLIINNDIWFLGIIFLIILPILKKIKMDTFTTIVTALFFVILIFNTLILNNII